MNEHDGIVKGWGQMVLVPPAASEITVRLGLVPESNHAQLQLEVTSATDGVLLAMASWPHFPISEIPDRLADLLGDVARWSEELSQPF